MIRVRATATGFFNNERRRPGDVFSIGNETQFSTRWMERVPEQTPERSTSSQEWLDRECAGAPVRARIHVVPETDDDTGGEVLHEFDPYETNVND